MVAPMVSVGIFMSVLCFRVVRSSLLSIIDGHVVVGVWRLDSDEVQNRQLSLSYFCHLQDLPC